MNLSKFAPKVDTMAWRGYVSALNNSIPDFRDLKINKLSEAYMKKMVNYIKKLV